MYRLKPVAFTGSIWLAIVALLLSGIVMYGILQGQDKKEQSNELPSIGDMITCTAERKKYINHLLDIITDPKMRENNREKVVDAIDKLGKVRAVRAAPELVDLLLYRRKEGPMPGGTDQKLVPGYVYPAEGALDKIGKPAVPYIIDAVIIRDSEMKFTDKARSLLNNILEGRENLNEYIKKRMEVYKEHTDRLKPLLIDR